MFVRCGGCVVVRCAGVACSACRFRFHMGGSACMCVCVSTQRFTGSIVLVFVLSEIEIESMIRITTIYNNND
jgi:hypothetical protein